jgi:hypothetical protein
MGHTRIGELRATRKWRQVIEMIAFGSSVEDIARATSLAAETAFCAAARDAAVQHAFYLLSQVPTAAASQDFAGELRRAGMLVGPAPTLPEICSALIEAVDRQSKWTKGRTDLGELAVLSAVESLSAVAGRETPTLFGPSSTPQDTRSVLRGFAKPSRFALLSRDFFARLTRRYLDYYLSRELPKHVGLDRRFPTLSEHQGFEEARATARLKARIKASPNAGEA